MGLAQHQLRPVGGYRSARHEGRALVKNKGSRGREEKMIYFTSTVERLLQQYIRTERAKYDPQGIKRLEELDDRAPLFLTRTGKPYTRSAFYHHWKKLFEPAQQQWTSKERVEFSPHDLRHLRVTRAVTKIREATQGDVAKEAALLEGFQHLMGWSSLATMATYTKTMNKRKALEAILADEEEQERHAHELQEAPLKIQEQRPQKGTIHSQWTGNSPASAQGNDDEFSWYEESV